MNLKPEHRPPDRRCQQRRHLNNAGMPSVHDDDDDESDGLSESEYPDEADQDDEEDSSDECPHCGRAVYHDAERCPHCGEYITQSVGSDPKVKWIAIALLIAMGLGIIWWLL